MQWIKKRTVVTTKPQEIRKMKTNFKLINKINTLYTKPKLNAVASDTIMNGY